MTDDRAALGIPPDASLWTARRPAPEDWEIDEIGIRVEDPPPRPWPWPYGIIGRRGRVFAVIQMWRRTFLRPGFAYSVLWHPERGRTYRVESVDPDIQSLVRDAQRLFRRETRGRKRRRPTVEQFLSDRTRIRHANGGIPPSAARMAEEYGVRTTTVDRWLQRPEWSRVKQDK